ncbi:MAG: hypothetical protein U1F43_19590 [Myxococcota bacterium]
MSSRAHRLALALLPLASLALAAPLARAIPAPDSRSVQPPRQVDGARRVFEDAWRIDCHDLRATSTCLVIVTTRSYGAGTVVIDDPQELQGDAGVKLDGAPQWNEPTVGEDGRSVQRLDIPDGEHIVVVTRKVGMHDGYRLEWAVPADQARHVMFHRGQMPLERALSVAMTPPGQRDNSYAFELAVTRDDSFAWATPAVVGDPDWVVDGQVMRLRVMPPRPAADLPYVDSRFVSFRDPGQRVHLGGPMLGIGARLSDSGAFRMRFEYEVAIDDWMLPGLSLDADTGNGWELTPRFEIASPLVIIIPSASIGIGFPLKLRADPDLGVRLLAGLQYGPVGISASFDFFPGADTVFEPSLLLRISL